MKSIFSTVFIQSLTALMVIDTVVDCYPAYQANIPNGVNVPNSCKIGSLWPGVGHKNLAGGGDRNPFGSDFERLQHVSK
jgi:dopamine beta-monooxygenase